MPIDSLHGRREAMSSVDTAWLRMERPTNLMMITIVMSLDSPIDVAALKRVLTARLLRYPRFRQRARRTLRGWVWETDPHFDLDLHVRRVALPGAADKQALETLASDLASTRLDQSAPMWQIHVVENFTGGSALIFRIHHCYADGIALIRVLLSITDEAPAATDGAPGVEDAGRLAPRGGHCTLFDPLAAAGRAASTLARSLKCGRQALEEGRSVLRHPGRVAGYLQQGRSFAAELAKLALIADEPSTRFKGPLGRRKCVAWADPVSLDEIKAVSKALGCTVNDVLLSSVAGALGAYLRDSGDSIEGLQIKAAVPVNLRVPEDGDRLGSAFGLVLLRLPVGDEDPVRRLAAVHRDMAALKGSQQAGVTLGLLGLMGRAPVALQRRGLDLLSRKASAVMTNVPGPQHSLHIAGCRILDQMFWVPQTAKVGVGVSILSYDGQVHFGVITDRNLVPDPHGVITRFAPEFEKLVLWTLMGGA